MELAFKVANASNFKKPTYNLQGQLTVVDIWETPAMLVKLFSKALAYTDGKLTTSTLTRISDGATLVRTLTYAAEKWDGTTSVYTP
jgi:hypothetical protein